MNRAIQYFIFHAGGKIHTMDLIGNLIGTGLSREDAGWSINNAWDHGEIDYDRDMEVVSLVHDRHWIKRPYFYRWACSRTLPGRAI